MVLPNVVAIADRHSQRTLFTRFVAAPIARPWRGHVAAILRTLEFDDRKPRRGHSRTRSKKELLARFVPPAMTFDKNVYSP